MRIYWSVVRFLKGLPWQFQRHVRWLRDGYDPEDIWSLDSACARWLAPRLEGLRDCHSGHPVDLDDEPWTAMIDKMAQSFRFVENQFNDDLVRKDRDQYVSEGLHLFAEYFQDLWD